LLSAIFLACSSVLAARNPFAWSLVTLHIVGWACGALAPMVLLVLFRLRVRALLTRPDYTFRRFAGVLITSLAVLGVAIGAYHGWYVASWFAS
jgi:hypothetical protein